MGAFNSKNTARRFVVIRERLREGRQPAGRKLFDVPGYTYRIMVTDRNDSPVDIWRDYNKRADLENRIMELKHDLAADVFCMKQFYATETAFRSILMLFNLLAEFQRASGMAEYRPATLRYQVFHSGPSCLEPSWGKKAVHPVILCPMPGVCRAVMHY